MFVRGYWTSSISDYGSNEWDYDIDKIDESYNL